MRIDINEEINKTQIKQPVNNTIAAAAQNSKETGVSAVFENGIIDGFLEKEKNSGVESYDESFENKKKQQKLCSVVNSMNEKELAQIKEESACVEDEEIEAIVTVQEKIRMKLAAYCDDFDSGMVEEFSKEQLSQISSMEGNVYAWANKLKDEGIPVTEYNLTNVKNALEMASQLTGISDAAKAYFIQNSNSDVTIKSIYISNYSTSINKNSSAGNYYSTQAGGYVTQNSIGDDFEAISSQVKEMLLSEGIQITDEIMQNSKWLYDRQLPIDKNSLERLNTLNQLQFPMTEEALRDVIAEALKDGKIPVDASLTGETLTDIINKSSDVVNTIQNTDDNVLKAAIAAVGEDVTIADLKAVISGEILSIEGSIEGAASKSVEELANQISDDDVRFVAARRQLEEIRLQMTVEAAAVMEKNGISVDTQSLFDLIDNLKAIEDKYNALQLSRANVEPSRENIDLYSKINKAVENIGNSHAGLISVAASKETALVMSELEAEGIAFTDKYKDAQSAYETVMTKPRADMGDSINKAFRNVDDILDEMNLEKSQYNQRAVRILGYNNMEITIENIEKVKAADASINKMLSEMTPSAVVKMIRDDYNPMNVTVEELNLKLNEYKDETNASNEKYSEFLWKMEQHKEITQTEKESYIGIYRLLNQIEKSDGALVGALVSQGASLTMDNLLSASRTRKHSAMDYKIDDDFNGYDSKLENSISEQIQKGFSSQTMQYMSDLSAQVLSNININGLEQAFNNDFGQMSFEQFAQFMQNTHEFEDLQKDYLKQKLENFRQVAQNADKQVFDMLNSFDITASINNIEAAELMLKEPGSWFKKLLLNENDEYNELFEKAGQLFEKLGETDDFTKDYESFGTEAEKYIKEISGQSDNYVDVKAMKQLSTQLTVSMKMAREEVYQVPVEIGGELTSINLKFRLNTNEQKKVTVSMDTQTVGSIYAEFTVSDGKLKGMIVAENKESCTILKKICASFESSVVDCAQLTVTEITYVENNNCSSNDIFTKDSVSSSENVSSKQLYQVAKAFIEAIRENFK